MLRPAREDLRDLVEFFAKKFMQVIAESVASLWRSPEHHQPLQLSEPPSMTSKTIFAPKMTAHSWTESAKNLSRISNALALSSHFTFQNLEKIFLLCQATKKIPSVFEAALVPTQSVGRQL